MNGKTNKLIVILLIILILAVLGVGALIYFDINSNEKPTDSNPVGETDKDNSNDNADKDNNEQDNENKNDNIVEEDNNEISNPIYKPDFGPYYLDFYGDSGKEALYEFNEANYFTIDNFDITINNSKHIVTVVYNYAYTGCNYEALCPTVNRKIFIDNKYIGTSSIYPMEESYSSASLVFDLTEEHKNEIKKFADFDINKVKITDDYFKILKGTDNKEYFVFITGNVEANYSQHSYVTIINENGKVINDEIFYDVVTADFTVADTNVKLRFKAEIYDDYIEYSYYDSDKGTFNIAKLTISNDKVNYEIIKTYDNVIGSGGIR